MTRRSLIALLLLAATAVSGCGLLEGPPAVAVPMGTCDPVRTDPPPSLVCEAALVAVVERLSQDGVVATASFHYGAPCAPNMRCAFAGDVGYVVVLFADGRCGHVEVGLAPEDVFPSRASVSALEAWPPPEWLEMGVPAALPCE